MRDAARDATIMTEPPTGTSPQRATPAKQQGLSPKVVEETRVFWEGRAGEHVSEEDARESIRNVSSFFSLLAEWDAQGNTPVTEAADTGDADTGPSQISATSGRYEPL